jgi:hypothetical protein
MPSVKKILAFCWICCISITVHGKNTSPVTFEQVEINLRILFSAMTSSRNDMERTNLADSIAGLMARTLRLPGAFEYPFDSIRTMGKITSDDDKLRIFTWNLPYTNGTNRYYGFLQYKSPRNILVFRLTDNSEDLPDPAQCSLSAGQWYGALIYGIVETKDAGTTYYTLLGYDPHNLFVSRKITDVLYFTATNEPQFGHPLFNYRNRKQCRIVFEYSAKVQMSLRWDESIKMIVFDHLAPSNPLYRDNYQYYGPDFSYDAFRFENGMWELVEDVNVKNSDE